MEEHRSRSDERFCFLRVMNIQVAESKLAKWLQHTLSGRLHLDRAHIYRAPRWVVLSEGVVVDV